MSYSEFVHEGVWSLVTAVLLSAAVLVVLFQQAESITRSRVLRILSYVWIAQNLALLASVLLRLKLYVDAYQLTERRVYVAFFLVLVATGFGLLAWRIRRAKPLSFLLFANLIATFTLFFIVQFLDVARWVADTNVARWERDPQRTLDVAYLESLGPSAYRALVAAGQTPSRAEAAYAHSRVEALANAEQHRLATRNWRSVQLRADTNARWLIGAVLAGPLAQHASGCSGSVRGVATLALFAPNSEFLSAHETPRRDVYETVTPASQRSRRAALARRLTAWSDRRASRERAVAFRAVADERPA